MLSVKVRREIIEWCQAFCLGGGVFIGILLLTLLTGCAGADPGGVVAPGTFVWLPSDSPGYAAQQAWGLGLRANPAFHSLSGAEVDRQCGHDEGEHTVGCFEQWQDGSSDILIQDDLSDAERFGVMLHEVGHAIRPDLPHIKDGCGSRIDESSHVMCSSSMLATTPTDADFDWALSE